MADTPLVDVDAGSAYARPFRIVLALTFVAGVLDAAGFGQFGVFTANQAGNLVIGWTLLPDEPAAAVLSFASILGCGLGVVAVVASRHAWHWLGGRTGSQALLVTAAVLIVVAAVIGVQLTGSEPALVRGTPDLGTTQWWGEAASVSMSAFSVAMLATVFISGAGMRAPILASTNAYVDAVRYGAAAGLNRGEASWRGRARRAAAFPLAWTIGAASTVLLPFGVVAIAACAAVVIVGVVLLARRVNDPAG